MTEGPLLAVEGAVKHFPVRGARRPGRGGARVHAVDGVDLELQPGETLGLVGESGSGKSTLARLIAGLQPLTAGRIIFDGQRMDGLSRRRLRPLRRDIQMIFQDPYGSLNPRRRVGSIIGDPLAIHRQGSGAARRRAVQELMEVVGLNPEHYNRFPAEFSGGQRQRVGIARALALRPRLLICDEPVSALDMSIRAQVVNLLTDLRAEFGLTYLFIAHDLAVVRHVSTRVAVMYLGKVVEVAAAEALYARPTHPYTNALLSAVPVPDPRASSGREQIILTGEMPSPVAPPAGCRFHTRCPKAQSICAEQEPPLVETGTDSGHLGACWFPVQPGEDLIAAIRSGPP
jgi:oligopeptide/dipeptide ABC transporter ATP-binding protein